MAKTTLSTKKPDPRPVPQYAPRNVMPRHLEKVVIDPIDELFDEPPKGGNQSYVPAAQYRPQNPYPMQPRARPQQPPPSNSKFMLTYDIDDVLDLF